MGIGGGLKERGLINFLPLKREGLLERGGAYSSVQKQVDTRFLILASIENQAENRDLILDCCVLILDSCKTHQTGTTFV